MIDRETVTIDPQVIKSRRELLNADAPCVGCGSSRTRCEAGRGNDPTAPDWFGCCARGTDMRPCSHRVDPGANEALLREIESGTVQPVADILAERAAAAARRERERGPLTPGTTIYEQGEWWRQKGGNWIRITDMKPSHRLNTAALLLRNASTIVRKQGLADIFRFADAPDEVLDDALLEDERRSTDPEGWVLQTRLYTALTDGLELDDRLKHLLAHPLPRTMPVCAIPDCGCSGEAHP